jgi:valyl-tRNA synthetase
VLDTWFSSALWPFSTLGWPDDTPEIKRFYPTSVLVTGFDIIFFWVARMMMMGLHFMQKERPDAPSDQWVPFHDVYIHALVRDERGQKMSKSKGNVIDPLAVIDEYGADALRFTLAAMAAQGRDIKLSAQRVEGYRNFATKLWNAARFAEINGCARDPAFDPRKSKELLNRWIAHETAKAAHDVTAAIGAYKFNDAAGAIYRFVWNVFCDWYLELIKPRLTFEKGDDNSAAQATCANLVSLFEASLRLLHPVMPFITEEIWQAIYEGKAPAKSIALAAYPQADEEQVDLAVETDMAILQDLIVSVRNLRAELKVEPKGKVPVELSAPETAIRAMIEQNRGAVERLANVDSITFVNGPFDGKGASRSTARFDVHVIYEAKIDLTAECERLKKDLEKIEKGIASGQRQLGNEQFLAKAPANVVENLRKQQQELAVLQEKAQSKLAELGCS